MKKDIKSGLLRYGLAGLVFVVVAGSSVLLRWFSIRINFTIPVVAGIFVVAWFGGRKPGLLLAVLMSATTMYLNPIAPDRSIGAWAFGHLTVFAVLVFIVLIISGRRLVESKLRESEESFRTMANSMSQLAWIAKPDGFIFWYNQRWYDYTGTTPEQMEGWGWQSVHDPEVLPLVMEKWPAAIDAGTEFEMEFPLRGADGKFLGFLTRAVPLKDNEGKVVQWFGTNTDVDQIRRVQESLNSSRAELKGIIESAMDAIISVNETGKIILFNSAAERMFDYPANEAIGQSLDRFIPDGLSHNHSEHIDIFDKTHVTRRSMGSIGALCGLRSNGHKFPIEAAISQIETDGNKVYTVILRDITERKKAEDRNRQLNEELEQRVLDRTAKLDATNDELRKENAARRQAEDILKQSEESTRLIIDTARDAFIAIDSQGNILKWNTQAEVTFGWLTDEMIGRQLSETIIPPQHRQAHKHGLQHFRSSGHGPVVNQRIEITALHRDGHEFPIELTIWPMKIGTSYTFNSFIRDITENKRSEEIIRKLNETLGHRANQLEAANRELESFSYSVSHDLRAPLRHIDGFSKALLEDYSDKLDDQGKGYLDHVRGASQEMARLIDDVLQLARVTRSDMHSDPVDLSELARSVVDEITQDDKKRKVTIQIEDALLAYGDKRLLRILLVNLICNSWKFTSKRIDAEIEFGAEQKDGQTVYFIRDNGVGFDMTYVGKLFGAFQRLHSVEEFEGTGIGLATVARVANRHGGKVWAEAVVDKGATFYFTLPDFKEEING